MVQEAQERVSGMVVRPEALEVTTPYGFARDNGGGVVFEPSEHTLVKSKWMESMKRGLGKPGDDLFLYFNRWTGNFVVAKWLFKPGRVRKGIMAEIEVFNGHPDRMRPGQDKRWTDAPSFEYMQSRLRPAEEIYKNICRKMRALNEQKRREAELEADLRKEAVGVCKWIHRHRVNSEAPLEMERGMVPLAASAPGVGFS